MRSVQATLAGGLAASAALLCGLAATVGLSPVGWVVGLACGIFTNVALYRGLRLAGALAAGPADVVTLTRATLVGGVAAVTATSLGGGTAVDAVVGLTVVALALDGVDGWVARRTGTSSDVGARFDWEVDAFLMLVLCVYVAPSVGWWVLAIGAARYVFVVCGWLMPWLRRALPPRYWRKVVAAAQGIALVAAATQVLPLVVAQAGLIVALALLTESFGRDVLWLWRRRDRDEKPAPYPHEVRVVGTI